MMRFVRFDNRSIGVLPGTIIFIGISFCRAAVAVVISRHVSGNSVPVRALSETLAECGRARFKKSERIGLLPVVEPMRLLIEVTE